MSVTDPKFNPSGSATISHIKTAVVALEEFILSEIPDYRRRRIALEKLEDFSMWAVKAAAAGDA